MATGRPEPITGINGPYLINFFASWCAPCEVEHPVLVAMKDEGVPIVGIAYKNAPDAAQGFLTRLGDPFARRLIDRDGRAGLEFGVTGVPETYLVAPTGIITSQQASGIKPPAARPWCSFSMSGFLLVAGDDGGEVAHLIAEVS